MTPTLGNVEVSRGIQWDPQAHLQQLAVPTVRKLLILDKAISASVKS
jgi:hypothetical protein